MARRAKGWKVYSRGNALWVWWADGNGGKERRRLTDEKGDGLENEASASEINSAAARLYAEWCGLVNGEVPSDEDGPLTLGRLCREYAESNINGWDRRTIYDTALYMKTLERFFPPETDPRSITIRQADKYKLWLLAKGSAKDGPLASVTAGNRFAFAIRLFDWAVTHYQLPSNPFRAVKPIRQKPVRKKEPFTVEETAQILRTCRESFAWFYPVALIASVTGTRRGPIPKMRVGDYDRKARALIARPDISKGEKGHLYYLPEPVAEVMDRVVSDREATELLFVGEDGRPLNEKIFDKPDRMEKPPRCRVWYRLLRAAEVEPRGIHNLRRGAVSNLVARNVNIDRVTSVTGQTVEVARDHYLQIDSTTQRGTMDMLVEMYGVGEKQKAKGEENG